MSQIFPDMLSTDMGKKKHDFDFGVEVWFNGFTAHEANISIDLPGLFPY